MTRENTAGTAEYAAFGLRMLRSYGRRAAAGECDEVALESLAMLAREVERQTAETVRAMRSEAGGSYSWQYIGDALGITRAAAFKRYGHLDPDDARKPGAQPLHLR